MSRVVDYIIVGQGLAGSILSFLLIEAGASVMVLQDPATPPASKVAAGIVNPVTGRKFVKSWGVDDFFPAAFTTYERMQRRLSIPPVFQSKSILRVLSDIEQENNWLARSGWPGYERHMRYTTAVAGYQETFHGIKSLGVTLGGGNLTISPLLEAIQTWLEDRDMLRYENVDYKALELGPDRVGYRDLRAKAIIFCEGHSVLQNPFFQSFPFEPAKGEVLLIHAPGLALTDIIKGPVFMVPYPDDIYWVGSTYAWEYEHADPTRVKYEELLERLNAFLKLPYTVEAHVAGVRPSTRDRRPIIGAHPQHPSLWVFNGFGTKGASLIPFWAQHFASFLQGEVADLDEAVWLGRFLRS